MDPGVLARQRALRAYVNRRRVDVGRIVDYLERHLENRERINGEDLSISSVEDFIAFTQIDDRTVTAPGFLDAFDKLCRTGAPYVRYLCAAVDIPF